MKTSVSINIYFHGRATSVIFGEEVTLVTRRSQAFNEDEEVTGPVIGAEFGHLVIGTDGGHIRVPNDIVKAAVVKSVRFEDKP